jgi:transcriptional regulator with XRE-family HTH domain
MTAPYTPPRDLSEVVRFAADLRALRERAGMTYSQLSARSNYARSTLAEAGTGRALPSWALVRAFVVACGADEDEWRRRWEAAARDRLRWRDRVEAADPADGERTILGAGREPVAVPGSAPGPERHPHRLLRVLVVGVLGMTLSVPAVTWSGNRDAVQRKTAAEEFSKAVAVQLSIAATATTVGGDSVVLTSGPGSARSFPVVAVLPGGYAVGIACQVSGQPAETAVELMSARSVEWWAYVPEDGGEGVSGWIPAASIDRPATQTSGLNGIPRCTWPSTPSATRHPPRLDVRVATPGSTP